MADCRIDYNNTNLVSPSLRKSWLRAWWPAVYRRKVHAAYKAQKLDLLDW